MFKTFSTITILSLLALSAAQAQSEQPMQAKVPFAFTVQNTTLLAGNYRLTYSQTAHILSIQGLDQNPGAAFIRAMPSVGVGGPGSLMFHCDGKNCYLAHVSQGAAGLGLHVPQGGRERTLSFQTRVVSMTTAAR